jgi:hypothetical protein
VLHASIQSNAGHVTSYAILANTTHSLTSTYEQYYTHGSRSHLSLSQPLSPIHINTIPHTTISYPPEQQALTHSNSHSHPHPRPPTSPAWPGRDRSSGTPHVSSFQYSRRIMARPRWIPRFHGSGNKAAPSPRQRPPSET